MKLLFIYIASDYLHLKLKISGIDSYAAETVKKLSRNADAEGGVPYKKLSRKIAKL